ncbi:hypothetical protein DDM66_17765 [Vibrio cholerae]|nr:hypothetical protein [Vibrio cholerae]
MSQLKYTKPEKVNLKNDPSYNEKWVQNIIAEDPSILRLGDLILKDKERAHSGAGRLDLLCQDSESNKRYEIEIQLGKTDESHIIRTIEYWDLEKKRYPQYEHAAVIIAEEITTRFLNVINLFNGSIPLVAIQMQAFKVGDQISLIFTTVLNEIKRGLVDEDEEAYEITDRTYWKKRASKSTLEMTDELITLIKTLDQDLEPKYNKFYIGLAKNAGQINNFVIFRPKKDWVRLEPRLAKSDEIQSKLEEAGVDVMDYDSRWGRYRIRLSKTDLKKHENLLLDLLNRAYQENI